MTKAKILLAEDDPNLGLLLQEYLEEQGYSVSLCRDGLEAEHVCHSLQPDVCVLDVMMPKRDGFELAALLKQQRPTLPIIFTTARGRIEDKAEGFALGADDYLTKPFSVEELVMRVEAVLKRSQGQATDQDTYEIGTYQFSYPKRTLSHRGGEVQRLSSKESELLKMLCLHWGHLLTREQALARIWGGHNYYTSRSMDVYITKLRKYLRQDPRLEILNVHGEGFKLLLHPD
ncbi:MAG: response regulator transcription factor [Bacteroidetes bacterium]|jgi:DNA-binding response OmpR family regulator|nr:response regulator transcription factor [Bacteroidota bacterium]